MILGVDHIGLSAASLGDGIGIMRSLGYEVRFAVEDLANHDAKRPFLRQWRPRHAIAYCALRGCVAVEVTVHSATLPVEQGPYEVLCSGQPGPDAEPLHDVFDGPATKADARMTYWRWPAIRTRFATSPGMGDLRIGSVAVSVVDIDASTRWWTDALGFRYRGSPTPGVHDLDRASPVADWRLDLMLVSQAAHALPMLDDTGFTVLALITTDIAEDAPRVSHGAAEVGRTFEQRIAGRNVRLAFVRGPSGELVELVEVHERPRP